MLEFYREKGIKQEFSNARTPQQNRDCYEKKLIQVQKIHTDLNVADLLTKPFDGPRYYLKFERMLQAQLGHEEGNASCHLPIGCKLIVWICQISKEISQKRTRERMSDQEAKDLKAEAREIMPQLYLSKTKAQLQ
ncbi:hypothetical protein Tco_1426358 [Tanacetum coccineum]